MLYLATVCTVEKTDAPKHLGFGISAYSHFHCVQAEKDVLENLWGALRLAFQCNAGGLALSQLPDVIEDILP